MSKTNKAAERSPLTGVGVKHWDYVPMIFSWPIAEALAICSLDAAYQRCI